MSNIWFISDTHFNHKNILKFTDEDGKLIRPGFSSIEDMNETIINNWNEYIKPEDKVYHLGDVFMGSKSWIEDNWNRLRGKKRLIVGNHDNISYIASKNMFQKILLWGDFSDFGFLATHVPTHASSLVRRNKMVQNIHGHIHEKESPPGPYYNISVERNNYYPYNIDELKVN